KTQSELDDANTALLSAISTFKATAYADKSPLSKAIATATVLSNNAPIGTANGDYPQSAKDDLDAAIASAQTVYNKVGLTETEMNSAIDALNTAINTFKASVLVIADKSELKDLIAVATSILNTTEAGTQVGQYSAAKRKSLENALKNAQDVYDDASSSQSLVNIRVSSLKAAYNAYMSSKVTSTAVDDVEFALAIYPNPCTDVLSIESSNTIAKVNIVGMNGMKYSSEIDNTSSQIEVSRLANGVYSLQIFFENGTVKVMSFVKK
ncbi:MAG: T9SS type A sorting domain-containing protein, partial [Bacteroidales bacterium]|nr:T9SS type A sorting domain-containing protein [Bacteroidales bacterium]